MFIHTLVRVHIYAHAHMHARARALARVQTHVNERTYADPEEGTFNVWLTAVIAS